MPGVRQAEAADLAVVAAITHAAYAPYVAELGDRPVPMTEDHAALIQAGAVFLFGLPDQVQALVVLDPASDHLGIDSLAVDPAHQGQGLGRFMLDWAVRRAGTLGLPELRLLTNDRMRRNIGIYTRFGFVETGRGPNPKRAGWVSVYMAKAVEAGGS